LKNPLSAALIVSRADSMQGPDEFKVERAQVRPVFFLCRFMHLVFIIFLRRITHLAPFFFTSLDASCVHQSTSYVA
jgi:hypothetical protein